MFRFLSKLRSTPSPEGRVSSVHVEVVRNAFVEEPEGVVAHLTMVATDTDAPLTSFAKVHAIPEGVYDAETGARVATLASQGADITVGGRKKTLAFRFEPLALDPSRRYAIQIRFVLQGLGNVVLRGLDEPVQRARAA